jgi:hypothetical protein
MPRQLHFPKVVGVRLSETDGAKLQMLCNHAHRLPSDLVRLLIRTAQTVDVAPIRFDAPASAPGLYGVPDGGNSLVTEAGTAG